MGAQWSQFFPPKPTFSPDDFGPQDGKVFIVTGGSSGIGFELTKILYRKNATVYIAARSKDKTEQAMADIRADSPNSKGRLEFLSLQLEDLASIKESVQQFTSKESKLHVLWNNAGVSQPPLGSVSKQGIELQLATNCLGPFLFTQLLLPTLKATAGAEDATPPRVVWLSSQIVELSAPRGGIIMDEIRTPPNDKGKNYTSSKAGNWFLSAELARRSGPDGIISVALNPGAVSTNLFRHTPWLTYLAWPLLYTADMGALTELFAGLSPDITANNNGCYVVPWGKISENPREDIVLAMKPKDEGGNGVSAEFWEFCLEKTKDYM